MNFGYTIFQIAVQSKALAQSGIPEINYLKFKKKKEIYL